jgi:hypothetical protein
LQSLLPALFEAFPQEYFGKHEALSTRREARSFRRCFSCSRPFSKRSLRNIWESMKPTSTRMKVSAVAGCRRGRQGLHRRGESRRPGGRNRQAGDVCV